MRVVTREEGEATVEARAGNGEFARLIPARYGTAGPIACSPLAMCPGVLLYGIAMLPPVCIACWGWAQAALRVEQPSFSFLVRLQICRTKFLTTLVGPGETADQRMALLHSDDPLQLLSDSHSRQPQITLRHPR